MKLEIDMENTPLEEIVECGLMVMQYGINKISRKLGPQAGLNTVYATKNFYETISNQLNQQLLLQQAQADAGQRSN